MFVDTMFVTEIAKPYTAVDRDGYSIQVTHYRYLVMEDDSGFWVAAGPVLMKNGTPYRGGRTGSFDLSVDDVPLDMRKQAAEFYLHLGISVNERLLAIARGAIAGEGVTA